MMALAGGTRTWIVGALGALLCACLGGSALANHVPDTVSGSAPPAAPNPGPSVGGSARAGEALTGNRGTWQQGTLLTSEWLRCDASGLACAGTGDIDLSHDLSASDIGSTFRLQVTGTNPGLIGIDGGTRTTDSPRSAIVQQNPPTAQTPPSITGVARQGRQLQGDDGQYTGPGAPFTVSDRTWLRCNGAGGGCYAVGSGPTYVLVAGDVGYTIRYRVRASGSYGSATHSSSPAGPVQTDPPVNTSPPSVPAGPLRQGQTITGTPGSWAGPGAPYQYSYRWQRCRADTSGCGDIPGTAAAQRSYTPGAGSVGRRLRLRVTARGSYGSSTAASNFTAPVSGIRPSNRGAPQVQGTARDGEVLLASTGFWAGTTPITYSNRWERCSAAGDACTPTGDSGFFLRLGPEDVGKRIRAVVSARNVAGTSSRTTAATGVVAAKPKRRYRRLSPEPLVGISGTIEGHAVRLAQFAVKAPRGSRIVVKCRARACPFRRATRTIRRRSVLSFGSLVGRRFGNGAVIEVFITRKDRVGKYTRFRFRGGRRPARTNRCLVPGESRPSRCASRTSR